jgi:hypothetical protein
MSQGCSELYTQEASGAASAQRGLEVLAELQLFNHEQRS